MMEHLTSCINEAVTINTDGYYRTVTLLQHKNIDCPNLTQDEFIELMQADLEKALDEYKNIIYGEVVQSRKDYVAYRTKEAEEFAAKKWKTNKRREEYVQRVIFNAENDLWHICEAGIFFDFKPNVTEYIPGVCILSPGDDDNKLARCFEKQTESKWWKKATGWVFKYECGKDSLRHSFRPWIELIMDESSSAERKREEKALDDAISAWYGRQGSWTGD